MLTHVSGNRALHCLVVGMEASTEPPTLSWGLSCKLDAHLQEPDRSRGYRLGHKPSPGEAAYQPQTQWQKG